MSLKFMVNRKSGAVTEQLPEETAEDKQTLSHSQLTGQKQMGENRKQVKSAKSESCVSV